MANHKYLPSNIEKKWQAAWSKKKLFTSHTGSKKKRSIVLVEFPYPSGTGLHMGHLRPYVAGDIIARFFRMLGKEVMFPIGFDAFGLPAENYAIKMKTQPAKITDVCRAGAAVVGVHHSLTKS
jgi:leucyl-tRNA synthetase